MTIYTINEEAAYEMGAKGAEPTEVERLLFEAWMRGHCWALCATWDGKCYRSDAEQGGDLDPRAMGTRRLWAAWRDRAALQPSTQEPVAWFIVRDHGGGKLTRTLVTEKPPEMQFRAIYWIEPLYTHPAPQQPRELTNDELWTVWDDYYTDVSSYNRQSFDVSFLRAVLAAAHGVKP